MEMSSFDRVVAAAQQAGFHIAWHNQPGRGILSDHAQRIAFLPQTIDVRLRWRLLEDALSHFGLQGLMAPHHSKNHVHQEDSTAETTTEVSPLLALALLDECEQTLKAGAIVVKQSESDEPMTIRIRPGRLPIRVASVREESLTPTRRDAPALTTGWSHPSKGGAHTPVDSKTARPADPPQETKRAFSSSRTKRQEFPAIRRPDSTQAHAPSANPPPVPKSPIATPLTHPSGPSQPSTEAPPLGRSTTAPAPKRSPLGADLAFGAPRCELCEAARYALVASLALCRHHLHLSVRGALSPSEVRAVRRRHGSHPEVPFERYDDRGLSRDPGAWQAR